VSLFTLLGNMANVAALMGIVYSLIGIVAVARFARRPLLTPTHRPAVTLLKPVCGEDPGLYENLVSFCRQDYAGPVQILIGAHREDDPAVAIARRVISDLPNADVTLIIDGALPGTNFKICNVSNMISAAKHDVLIIADSDMRVEPHYLDTVVAELQRPGVGMVTCLYQGDPAGGVTSALGCAAINYTFLPSVLVGRLIGTEAGCFGATMAIRRSTLEQVGGLSALINQLADDHVLGALVRASGLKVVLSRYVVKNVVFEPDLATLARHELRWQRTIRSITPVGFAASIIIHPVGLSLLALLLTGFSADAWLVLATGLAVRQSLVYSCRVTLGGTPLSAPLVPVRDTLSFALFIASFLSQRVTWRDSSFRVGHGGELTLEGDPLR
jgi:ceramide glucosyltransferase